MQKYDLFLILSHNLSETEAPAKVEKIKEILASFSATDVETAALGRQKMAYSIKGDKAGYFVNVFFSLEPSKVAELKNNLTLDNEVARFMLTLKKDVPVPAETAAITSVFEKAFRRERTTGHRTVERTEFKAEEKVEKKTEPIEKKELNFEDINKKIDEILQQDTFVV